MIGSWSARRSPPRSPPPWPSPPPRRPIGPRPTPRLRSERDQHSRLTRCAQATARATTSTPYHPMATMATWHLATQASPPLQPHTTSPKVGHKVVRNEPILKTLGLGPYTVAALVSCVSTRHRPDQSTLNTKLPNININMYVWVCAIQASLNAKRKTHRPPDQGTRAADRRVARTPICLPHTHTHSRSAGE